MTEIFTNISDDIKRKAEIIWRMALIQEHPFAAAEFLNNIIDEYSTKWTEEEIEFLQFYLKTKMEMMKND